MAEEILTSDGSTKLVHDGGKFYYAKANCGPSGPFDSWPEVINAAGIDATEAARLIRATWATAAQR